MKLVAIVLTWNEAKHLRRCLASLEGVVDAAFVVDSFSDDDTVQIAKSLGAAVVQHPFTTQAAQFNWALTQLDKNPDWVLRIDADEYLTPELVTEINERLPTLGVDVNGVFCGRGMIFQGQRIRFGGVFPVRVLRLFRFGRGRCENRWMDEHIAVAGSTVNFDGELIDDNLNSLTWWTAKHNGYASREAVDLLNLEFDFLPHDAEIALSRDSEAGMKRWLKETVYARLPGGFRALAYFIYRFVFRLGFLDGKTGRAFHILQCFWYRYLVDAKVAEVRCYMQGHGCDATTAIHRVLGVRV